MANTRLKVHHVQLKQELTPTGLSQDFSAVYVEPQTRPGILVSPHLVSVIAVQTV